MKFIEVGDGISVRKDEIVVVERLNNGVSRVITNNNSYESKFSYETILHLLEMDKIEEKVSNTMNVRGEGSWGGQFWRG